MVRNRASIGTKLSAVVSLLIVLGLSSLPARGQTAARSGRLANRMSVMARRGGNTQPVAQHIHGETAVLADEVGPPTPPAAQGVTADSYLPLQPPGVADSSLAYQVVGQPVYGDGEYVVSEGGYGCDDCGAIGCDGSGCGLDPTCGAASCGCDSCVGVCHGACGAQGYHWIDTLSLHVGVQGFKNGINRGQSGSFGFMQGVNWGSPWVFAPLGMNTQIGFRGSQSDFHGADFTTEQRGQYFFTAGFYKKNRHGWQGGIVFDYLHDDWYTTIDLTQVRGELSLGSPTGSSLGFAFAQAMSEDETTSVLGGQSIVESWATQDYYTMFWEYQSNQHRYGKLRILGGATGESDAIFGTLMKIPLLDNWSLESEFTYVVPTEGAAQGGTQNESWNVAFNLVWYPARSMGRVNYAMSPMFDVAGNGSLIPWRK